MFHRCIIIAIIAASACARTTSVPEETARSDDSSGYFGDLKYVYRVYKECAAADLSSCLKLKLVSALDRAARAYSDVSLFEGVSFVKDPKATAMNEVKTEAELETTLPRSLTEKDEALNHLILDKVTNFFETHTLQVKLPTANELQRSFSEESRGKKKKGAGLLLLPLIALGTLIPLALGALALLAGKALIVSKLALVLAGIIGLKKLLSSGHGGGHESGHVEVVAGGHGSGWGRSYEKEQAQAMAYNAYDPKSR